MTEHPSPQQMRAVFRGGLTEAAERAVFCHLLRGCSACQAAIGGEYLAVTRGPAPEDEVYDAAIDRAFVSARRYYGKMQREATKTREALELLEQGGLEALFAGPDHLVGLGLVDALLARCEAVRHDNPAEAVRLAKVADAAAARLNPRDFGARRVADVQARAMAEVGNALRAVDRLTEAGEAFDRAFKRLKEGTGNEALEAHLFQLRASYYGTRREFPLAFAALEAAHDLYLSVEDRHRAGRTLIKKAIYKHYSGKSEEAKVLNQQGLALIDESREPGLALIAGINHLWFLVACGRFREAAAALFKIRPACVAQGGQVQRIRLRWLEGQIDAGQGELARAAGIFCDVRKEFIRLEMGFHAALTSLDLSLLCMRQKRTRDAWDWALEAEQMFAALEIQREALAAVAVLTRCFQQGKATLPLLESVVDFVRRSETGLDERFEPHF